MFEMMDFDKYGFAIFSESSEPDVGHRTHEYSTRQHLSEKGRLGFESLLSSWKDCNSFRNKLTKAVRQGVPSCYRALLWRRLLNVDALQTSSSFNYQAHLVAVREQLVDLGVSEYGGAHCLDVLCNMTSEDDEGVNRWGHLSIKHIRQIMLDLDRSYPTHRLFMGNTQEAKEGRASLFRLLSVYARYNTAVGYCQGMGFIAGMLLMHMSEVESFWCMVALFERHKYLLGYFDSSLVRIQTHAQVFHKILQQRLPRLHNHFESLGLHPLMYLTPWFMCLFTSLPCWDTVLAIWDKILLEGVWTIFPVALSILEIYENELLTVDDLACLLPRLLHLKPQVVSCDVLLPHVWSCTLEKWEVESFQAIVVNQADGTTRKRHRTDAKENAPSQAKRPRHQSEQPRSQNPSVFRKILNAFAQSFEDNVEFNSAMQQATQTSKGAPVSKSQRKVPLTTPSRRGKVKRAIKFNSPGTVQYTKVNSPGYAFSLQSVQGSPKFATPLRRSPRIAFQKWRNINTPSEKRLISRDPSVQHSFKSFHTPTPLRRSQRSVKNLTESPCNISLTSLQLTSPTYLSSPDIELKPLTRSRISASSVKVVL